MKMECPVCHEEFEKWELEEMYSFGVYAGRVCGKDECIEQFASGYRDRCGIDQPQGNPNDLDEPY